MQALKVWQRLAQEKSIPLSRFGDLLSDVVQRLGDVSWTVVRSAVQLVKAILESNPFGAKVITKFQYLIDLIGTFLNIHVFTPDGFGNSERKVVVGRKSIG